jgi:hypothetical protein
MTPVATKRLRKAGSGVEAALLPHGERFAKNSVVHPHFDCSIGAGLTVHHLSALSLGDWRARTTCTIHSRNPSLPIGTLDRL